MIPKEFLERMKGMLGDEYPAFLRSYEQRNLHALRINRLKGDTDRFLACAPFSLSPVAWEPDGLYYTDSDTPGKHPCHAAGVYYIQEASAMAPVPYLCAAPGEKILDLCAAPGGKSAQITAAMQNQGLLVSNEIHPSRAKILSENIERMGIRNCLVTNESPDSLAQAFSGFFDRILVDAPCSGEGMFRKNEAACDEWSLENIRLCADRQLSILNSAASMLRPGGRLVYSTCTFAPEENEGSVSRFLHAHPEFTIIPIVRYEGMSAGNPAWICDPAPHLTDTIRLFPHKLRGEGHFLAVLQKAGDPDTPNHGFCRGGMERGIPERDCREYVEFCSGNLKDKPSGQLIRFGEQLYLMPEEFPSLRGLKVLRPGLHLGTAKKGHFTPSHALALALRPEQVLHVLPLSSDEDDIQAYLNGQTLRADGEKGWYLITVDGYSVGWGKLAGGIMKNHYPKGLRVP